MECGELLFGYSPQKTAYIITSEVQRRLSEIAEKTGEAIESFASTLCFACYEKSTNRLMTFQLGDSNLYLVSDKGCKIPSYEKKTLPAFTVYDDADEKAVVTIHNAQDFNSVVLCSDGAWRKLYDKGVFKPDLLEIMKKSEFSKLKSFWEECVCEDDCSYILMNFNKNAA